MQTELLKLGPCMLLLDLIYKFNLQAVGYSRSSLPRGTQYNTQTEQMTIYTIYKNNLQTQRTVATTTKKNIHYYMTILIKK